MPYYILGLVGHNRGNQIHLGKKPDGYSEFDFPYPIPEEMGEFILNHTYCAECGSQFIEPLEPCVCNVSKDKIYARINEEDDLKWDTYFNIWTPIKKRELKRISSARRREALKARGGSYTKHQIAELYKVQDAYCYYCATKISDKNKAKSKFDIDHYDPVFLGGNDEITNIVLACKKCNNDKGNEYGGAFRTKPLRREHDKEIKKIINRIRQRVERFWASH